MTRGIHTLADLRERCHVDADTGCWHWRGARSGSGSPSARMPAVPGVTLSLGAVFAVLKTGELPAPGVTWVPTCSTPQCARHRKPVALGDVRRAAASRPRSQHGKASIRASRRARATVGSLAIAREIRASREPLRVVAARYGMSLGMAGLIRQGKRWAETLPAASVWAWRPVANDERRAA